VLVGWLVSGGGGGGVSLRMRGPVSEGGREGWRGAQVQAQAQHAQAQA
jgi:hypothetical protein